MLKLRAKKYFNSDDEKKLIKVFEIKTSFRRWALTYFCNTWSFCIDEIKLLQQDLPYFQFKSYFNYLVITLDNNNHEFNFLLFTLVTKISSRNVRIPSAWCFKFSLHFIFASFNYALSKDEHFTYTQNRLHILGVLWTFLLSLIKVH